MPSVVPCWASQSLLTNTWPGEEQEQNSPENDYDGNEKDDRSYNDADNNSDFHWPLKTLFEF